MPAEFSLRVAQRHASIGPHDRPHRLRHLVGRERPGSSQEFSGDSEARHMSTSNTLPKPAVSHRWILPGVTGLGLGAGLVLLVLYWFGPANTLPDTALFRAAGRLPTEAPAADPDRARHPGA